MFTFNQFIARIKRQGKDMTSATPLPRFLTTPPEPKYLTSNATEGHGFWHLAKRREIIGPVSGKVLKVFYVAACSGRQMGGAYGQSEFAALPGHVSLCKKCHAISKKA